MAHIPAFLQDHNIPAGTFNDNAIAKEINETVETDFGIKKVVLSLQNYQLYLDIAAVEKAGKDAAVVKGQLLKC